MCQHPEEMTATVYTGPIGLTCASISTISSCSATVEYDLSLNLRRVTVTVGDFGLNSGWTGFPSYLDRVALEEVTLEALRRWQEQLTSRALKGMKPWNSPRLLRSLYAHLVSVEKPRRVN